MKKLNNVLIIGCSISSLYSAIKLSDIGYKITLVEKKNNYHPFSQAAYHNFLLYNDNHRAYINLLRRFEIKGNKITEFQFSEKLFAIINNVIQKSKLIPQNIIMTHTFTSLCKYLISDSEFAELHSFENIFNGIFNIMNALDCINIFCNDLTYETTYYYLKNEDINELMLKMIRYIENKGAKIIFNNEVKNIKYIKKKFNVTTNTHTIFNSDLLFTSISKHNLTTFSFWNNDQKMLLNSVSAINTAVIGNMINKLMIISDNTCIHIQDDQNIRNVLLDKMHVVYPIFTSKSKYIYVWNNGVNNIIVREKIKTMYNDKFIICSEAFSKNHLFISYSLEYVDSAIIKLYKYTS